MTSTTLPAGSAAAQEPTRKVTSDRSKAENRLGQKLVAPAIILMLLVTAFPMIRAIWLSVYDYSLTAPDERVVIGIGNSATALTDPLFWKSTGTTVRTTVVTADEKQWIGR